MAFAQEELIKIVFYQDINLPAIYKTQKHAFLNPYSVFLTLFNAPAGESVDTIPLDSLPNF